ncbi:hypothetical protein QCA50_008075 [Cerrena zonata]|uniref:Histone-lysine N-methyltransferase, H3 lysine-36 specific n=1 Tax=Cerrena zonata TaxID=2478898 RepID=A0AAW0G7X6_9APHY
MSTNSRSQSPKELYDTPVQPYILSEVNGKKDVAKLFDEDVSVIKPTDVRDNVTAKAEEGLVKDEEDADTVMGDVSSSLASPTTDAKEELADLKLEDSRQSNTPPLSSKTKTKLEPQLIGHLPRAEEDALRTFTEIAENHYQYNTLGRSREELESMTCDCQYEHGVDDPIDACGDDCINRLTQVECLPDDCRCRQYCQNQRFQRKQYAPIHIVQTEKKGFGLRAAENLPKDTFIYEYVGDVVSQPSFLKRMRQYGEEGIRHFYFMMLQKEEYIDATKRGGIGRFANHSCNPNCYVAKWAVGDRVRMGIFASRRIAKHEELTFNYNVDRYGHEAQPCYCGEPNCVGFIGGKTQTDIAAMDDLFLDALGITDEVELLGLKGSKKRKGKKLDEDYLPTLKPLMEKDAPKLVQAMRQTQSRKVLFKLLTRIKLTEDPLPLRQLMRLRGFSVIKNILDDNMDDMDILTVSLECMMNWPLIQRNKVEDSKITEPVQKCAESENELLSNLAKELISRWDKLEYAYRIPKRMKEDGGQETPPDPTVVLYRDEEDARPNKRRRSISPGPQLSIKPLGFTAPPKIRETWREIPGHGITIKRQPEPSHKDVVAAVIAAAAAAKEQAALKAAADAERMEKAKQEKESKKQLAKEKASLAKQAREGKQLLKEKRLLKLVGAVVVKCMSKYQKQMDHDTFKKYAKELTQTIAEKEKKSSTYKENKLESLSDEKIEKKHHKPSGGKNGDSSATANDDHADDMQDNSSLEQAALDDIMDIDGDEDGDELQTEHVSPEELSPDEPPNGSRSSTHENKLTPSQIPLTLDSRGPHASDSDHDWAGNPV